MRDIWQELEKWHAAGKQIALATVVHLQGSSLRPEGSKMLICQSGEIAGSVTGGCVESAVYDESMAALKAGLPRLVSYGVSNESAWEVGLSCGGSVKILIEPLTSESWKQVFPLVKDCIQNNGTAALATAISGPAIGRKLLYFLDGSRAGSLGTPELDQTLISFLAENMSARDPLHLTLPDEQGEVFVEFLLPPPRLVIVGAGHISMPLVRLANELGFHTVVVDARSALATRERFPNVHELLVGWPSEILLDLKLDASTSVVCLSHDDKFDNPALITALQSPVRYVGALGSRKTHAARLDVLREEGVPEDLLSRIHAPVGLKIGARHPEEIALSILAEIVAVQHGAS